MPPTPKKVASHPHHAGMHLFCKYFPDNLPQGRLSEDLIQASSRLGQRPCLSNVPIHNFVLLKLFARFFSSSSNSDRPWELWLTSILNVEFRTKEGGKFREMIKALTWQDGLDLFRELVQIVQTSLILNSSAAA